MEAFYFKNKVKYLNGVAKDYCYYKIQKDGKVTTISTYRRTLSSPKGISIPIGFEVIEKEEFEKVKTDLGLF
jgi:hypothetical protein